MKFTRLAYAVSIMISFGLFSAAVQLKAQGAFDMGGLTGSLSIDHVTQAETARAVNRQIFDTLAPTRKPLSDVDLSYEYSKARTQQNLRTFVERTPVNAGRADLEQMITAQPTIIEEIGGAMRGYGLDPHNVADAYTMWWVNAWSASQKTNREPDRQTIAAVKQQTRNAFVATPDFAATNDQQRQEYAEALMLQALLLSAAFEQNQNNPAMLDQLAQAAKQGAKASGLDLSLMTLTENGFVPRSGADASGAGSGGEEVSLAMATDLGSGGEEESSYLGVALAAGAGLGLALVAGGALLRKS